MSDVVDPLIWNLLSSKVHLVDNWAYMKCTYFVLMRLQRCIVACGQWGTMYKSNSLTYLLIAVMKYIIMYCILVQCFRFNTFVVSDKISLLYCNCMEHVQTADVAYR